MKIQAVWLQLAFLESSFLQTLVNNHNDIVPHIVSASTEF